MISANTEEELKAFVKSPRINRITLAKLAGHIIKDMGRQYNLIQEVILMESLRQLRDRERRMTMDYLTTNQLKDWADNQEEGRFFCEHCLTRLVQTDEGLYYCPNEMCLNDEQGEIEPDEDEDGVDNS